LEGGVREDFFFFFSAFFLKRSLYYKYRQLGPLSQVLHVQGENMAKTERTPFTGDVNKVAMALMAKNEGKIIPTFNRTTCTAFYRATGINLNKVLYALANDGIITKDFIRFTPKKFKIDEKTGNYVMFVDGLEVIRKPGKDGKVSESIFYLNDKDEKGKYKFIPEFVQRRGENNHKINAMVDEIRQFSEGLVDHIGVESKEPDFPPEQEEVAL
jgi:hypothetical protein